MSFFFSLYLQWTYCLAASVVIGAAVWFYFITQSIKSVTYAPTILVGAGTSAMIVMSLTYLTDLIGEDKVCTLSLTICLLHSNAFGSSASPRYGVAGMIELDKTQKFKHINENSNRTKLGGASVFKVTDQSNVKCHINTWRSVMFILRLLFWLFYISTYLPSQRECLVMGN